MLGGGAGVWAAGRGPVLGRGSVSGREPVGLDPVPGARPTGDAVPERGAFSSGDTDAEPVPVFAPAPDPGGSDDASRSSGQDAGSFLTSPVAKVAPGLAPTPGARTRGPSAANPG